MVPYDDFKKLDLRIGQIVGADKVEGSAKLLKLRVNLGELGERQIIAGLAAAYSAEFLIGQKAVFITNLEPRKIMGLASQGMILAADSSGIPVLLKPSADTPPGSMVK